MQMKHKHRINLLLVFTILFSSLGFSQESKMISLDEAIELTRLNNKDLAMKKAEVASAYQEFQKTNSVFLPKIELSETGVQTDNPLNAFGILLQQEIVTAADFNPNTLNSPDAISNWTMQGSFEQPIFNMDGLYGRSASKNAYQAKEEEAFRFQQFVEFQVTQQYYLLGLARKKISLLEKSETLVEKSLELSTDYYDQGMVQKTDVLNMKVRLLEIQGQKLEAENAAQSINDYLGLLIGMPKGTRIEVSNLGTVGYKETLNSEVSVSAQRADLMALEHATEAQESMVKMNNASFVPRINAFGNYAFNDADPFGTSAGSYMIGISLNWKIFDGGKQLASTKQAKIEYEKSKIQLENEKEKAQLEAEKAYRNLQVAQINVIQAEQAMEEAQEAYEITKNRYESGLEKSIELIQAETQLSQKAIELEEKKFKLYMAHYYLKLQLN